MLRLCIPLPCVHMRNVYRRMSQRHQLSVGLIVIGDEILNGRVVDINSNLALKLFSEWGLETKRVTVVGDDLREISEQVSTFSGLFDYVVTSGGIGPTADDVTFEAVARAFNDKVELNEKFAKVVEGYFGGKSFMTESHYRLATIPSSSSLVYLGKYPVVKVNNVFILPGVPEIFKKSIHAVKKVAVDSTNSLTTASKFSKFIHLKKSELQIADQINQLFKYFEDKPVKLGSYPNFTSSYYKTKLTIDCADEKLFSEVLQMAQELFPPDSVVDCLIENPVALLPNSVYNAHLELTEMHEKLEHTISEIESALLEYSPKNVVLSFNGGKDCTLLLHLYAAVLYKKYPGEKVNLLFMETSESFEETTAFMEKTKELYEIDHFHSIKSKNIPEGLSNLKKQHPHIYGILMGTREADPHGSDLSPRTLCDPEYGDFMRINPILKWTYQDVWKAIRHFQIPYCILYDQGYTSLGSKSKTHKNPALFVEKRGEIEVYKPAWTLDAVETERASRN